MISSSFGMMLFGVAAVLGQAKIEPTSAKATLEEAVIQKVKELQTKTPEDYDGVTILAVQQPTKGAVRLIGAIAVESQKKLLEEDIKTFLGMNLDKLSIESIDRVEVNQLLIHDKNDSRNETKVRLIEKLLVQLLGDGGFGQVRVRPYDSNRKALAIYGFVDLIERREWIEKAIGRLNWFESVDCSEIVVRDDIQKVGVEKGIAQAIQSLRIVTPEVYDGVTIMAVEQPNKGVARLVGTIAEANHAKLLQKDLGEYLKPHVDRVQVDGLLVDDKQDSRNVVKVRLIEELLAKLLYDCGPSKAKVLAYDSNHKTLAICGAVNTTERRDLIEAAFKRLDGIKSVDCSQVIVMDDIRVLSSLSVLTNEAFALLAHAKDGNGVLALTEQIIRGGRTDARIWYLRAAGFLLNGDERSAIGAVRLAEYSPVRFQMFEQWQNGPIRHLKEMQIDQNMLLVLSRTAIPTVAPISTESNSR